MESVCGSDRACHTRRLTVRFVPSVVHDFTVRPASRRPTSAGHWENGIIMSVRLISVGGFKVHQALGTPPVLMASV